jgi:hypothetical protein
MPTYTLVEDSNLKTYLKEEGYGFIARGVVHHVHGEKSDVKFGTKVVAMNKGCDLAQEELERLWAEAVITKHALRKG